MSVNIKILSKRVGFVLVFILVGSQWSCAKVMKQPETVSFNGIVSLAPVSSATISAYEVNLDGSLDPTPIATTNTDSSGNYELFVYFVPTKPVALVATGGSYIEEASGADGPLVSLGNTLSAVVPNSILSSGAKVNAAVTPLTDIAYSQFQGQIQSGIPVGTTFSDAATNSNYVVSQAFGVKDVLTTIPTAPNKVTKTAEGNYALVLTALSTVAQNHGVDSVALAKAYGVVLATTGSFQSLAPVTATIASGEPVTLSPPSITELATSLINLTPNCDPTIKSCYANAISLTPAPTSAAPLAPSATSHAVVLTPEFTADAKPLVAVCLMSAADAGAATFCNYKSLTRLFPSVSIIYVEAKNFSTSAIASLVEAKITALGVNEVNLLISAHGIPLNTSVTPNVQNMKFSTLTSIPTTTKLYLSWSTTLPQVSTVGKIPATAGLISAIDLVSAISVAVGNSAEMRLIMDSSYAGLFVPSSNTSNISNVRVALSTTAWNASNISTGFVANLLLIGTQTVAGRYSASFSDYVTFATNNKTAAPIVLGGNSSLALLDFTAD